MQSRESTDLLKKKKGEPGWRRDVLVCAASSPCTSVLVGMSGVCAHFAHWDSDVQNPCTSTWDTDRYVVAS